MTVITPDHYRVHVRCPFCGGEINHVNEVASSVFHRRAVIECVDCLGQYVFELELIVHRRPRKASA